MMDEIGKSIRRENVQRIFNHGTRGETAAQCIGSITKGCDIFGLTKGDFSMINILQHIVSEIGCCDIDIGTWTAGNNDVAQASFLFQMGNIKSIRFLVDRSFPNRQPEYFAKMLQTFGGDCVRLARFHAKFIVLENAEYSVAVRTSMNLNMNKRIENYEISEGSKISGYLKQIVDYHFSMKMEDSYKSFKDLRIGPAPEIERLSNLDLETRL